MHHVNKNLVLLQTLLFGFLGVACVGCFPHRDTGDGQGRAEDKNGNDTKALDLRVAEPGRDLDQIHKTDKIANDLGRVAHARAPRICVLLLPEWRDIEDQRATDGLDAVQGKVEKVEGRDSDEDGPGMCLLCLVSPCTTCKQKMRF